MISSSTFLSDVILFIRNTLRSNLDDPLSRTNGIGFVMSAFPKRATKYPVVTIQQSNIDTKKLGMQSEKQWVKFSIEVQVYARNSKEVDEITQDIIDTLRTNQFGTSSTDAEEIHGLNITSIVPIVDVEGANTIHRKVITLNYTVIL